MNENVVSFSLAMKLKEKGFREEVNAYYGKWENLFDVHPALDMNDCDYRASAPTISQVLKWLRDEHVFHVEILREKYEGWQYFIQLSDASYTGHGSNYDSYEAAALAGIEYVLDNLI